MAWCDAGIDRREAALVRVVVAFAIWAAASCSAPADDKNPAEKPPQIILAMPLGISGGVSTRLTLRGLSLDETSGVTITAADQPIEAKILDKKKVPLPPNQPADIIGDTQIEIELTAPAETATDHLSLIVDGPKGKSEPYQLPITASNELIAEQEPNDALTQCQPISAGKTIVGSIHEAQNVDVFDLDGRAGDAVNFAVEARKYGSRLDALLWLHDSRGNLLVSADDHDASVDSQMRFTIPEDGKYFLTLMDANDLGGAAYGYRLSITSGSTNP